MSRRAAHSENDAHGQAQLLLPWLLAGTLEGEERSRVQAHVEVCERCRADLAWQRKLRLAGRADAPALDPGTAFQKLAPRLEPRNKDESRLFHFRHMLAANDKRWLRAAASAELGVIAALALLLLRPEADGGYHALGTTTGAQGDLVVMFKPDTPEREMRRILQASGTHLVGGPTVTDAYVLQAPPASTEQALLHLRAEPWVTMAQALAAEGAR